MKATAALPMVAALLLVAPPALAQTEQDCLDRFRAEAAAIERGHARHVPARGDRAAEAEWSRTLHEALAQASARAEACSRAARPPASAAAQRALADCRAQAAQQAAALDRRFAGRALSRDEQAALRTESQRLDDERSACLRAAVRR